jgi:hypothetical protein
MTRTPAAGALALALLAPATVTAMTETPPALTLDVREAGGVVEVRLVGLSARTQKVRYALEVTGQSTSRHRGSTTLSAGKRAVLSTMRTQAGESWCVKLVAEEESRAPYEVTRGTCAAG